MRKLITSATLALSLGAGSVTPILADGAASTRNIILGAAAAAALYFTVSNNNKKKADANSIREREMQRRKAQYRAWYRWRNGNDPSVAQVRTWYYNQFGEYPT